MPSVGRDVGRRAGARVAGRLRRTHAALVRRYRPYAIASAALADFREQRLGYHTHYFTFNAFLGTLAIFVTVTSLMGLLPHGGVKTQLEDAILTVMPIFRGPPDRTMDVFHNYQGIIGAVSIAFLLWTGTRIFDALENGFGIIWRVGRGKRYALKKGLGLGLIVVIGVLFFVTFEVMLGFSAFWGAVVGSQGAAYEAGVGVARPVIGLLAGFLMFLIIYRVLPGVKPGIGSCARAGCVAAVLFLGSQYVLNVYFDVLYDVPLIYGSLASGIVLILWLQLVGMVTFYGAEIAYHLEEGELVRRYVVRHGEAGAN